MIDFDIIGLIVPFKLFEDIEHVLISHKLVVAGVQKIDGDGGGQMFQINISEI